MTAMAFDFLTVRIGEASFDVDPEDFRVRAEDALRLMRDHAQVAGITLTLSPVPAPEPSPKAK